MSDTPQLLLAHHLKALKLPTFLREYDKQARQCAAEGVDHVRYLVRLTELELIGLASQKWRAPTETGGVPMERANQVYDGVQARLSVRLVLEVAGLWS